jgi:CSLREA domain-containing protein
MPNLRPAALTRRSAALFGHLQFLLLGAVLLAGSLLLKDAQAAVINVTTVFDEFNTGPSTCSLREAVQAANTDAAFGGCSAGSGADVIFLPVSQGVYRLQINGGDEDATSPGTWTSAASLPSRARP